MKIKIARADVLVVILWFIIFQFYTTVPQLYYIFQVIASFSIFIITLIELKRFKQIWGVLFFPIVIMLSSFINREAIGWVHMVRGIAYGVGMIDVFLVIQYYLKRKGKNRLLNILYKLSKLYFVINCIQIIIVYYTGRLNNVILNESFFSRGKFSVAYTFLIFLVMFQLSWDGTKIIPSLFKQQIFICLTLLSVFLCFLIQTSTGVVAIILYFLFSILPISFCKLLKEKWFIVLSIVAATVIVFSIQAILAIPSIQNVIVNLLHEDLSLTGRTELYTLLLPLMKTAGYFGSGFGSYVAQQLAYHGWYNAQNGLAEIILTYGYLGVASFCVMVFRSVDKRNNKFNRYLLAVIYVFIVISTIEIPFNLIFILMLALYNLIDNNDFLIENKNDK